MDIGRFLEIAANYVEIAFEKHLSLSVTLIAAGAIVAAAFLMLSMRILTSAKRRYSKREIGRASWLEKV